MADKKTTVVKKNIDYQVMPRDDLEKSLVTKTQDLKEATLSHRAGELVNPRVLAETRKEIARINTALRALDKENK